MKVLRPGDFNGDGVVNLNDWTEFNAAFVDPTLAASRATIDWLATHSETHLQIVWLRTAVRWRKKSIRQRRLVVAS